MMDVVRYWERRRYVYFIYLLLDNGSTESSYTLSCCNVGLQLDSSLSVFLLALVIYLGLGRARLGHSLEVSALA